MKTTLEKGICLFLSLCMCVNVALGSVLAVGGQEEGCKLEVAAIRYDLVSQGVGSSEKLSMEFTVYGELLERPSIPDGYILRFAYRAYGSNDQVEYEQVGIGDSTDNDLGAFKMSGYCGNSVHMNGFSEAYYFYKIEFGMTLEPENGSAGAEETFFCGDVITFARPTELSGVLDGDGNLRETPRTGAIPLYHWADFSKIKKHPQRDFVLKNDIECEDEYWGLKISGTFDGNGKTIYRSNEVLFAENTGTIKNVILDGDVMLSHGMVVKNKGRIENCKNFSNITVCETDSDPFYTLVFGVFADESSYIENCENYGNIVSDAGTIGKYGGIVGSGKDIYSCTNYGNILQTGENWGIGGIVGEVKGNISDCINYGDITGLKAVAGIAGTIIYYDNASSVVIARCNNYGSIQGNKCIGGIIGSMSRNAVSMDTVKHCSNEGSVIGDSRVGGICGDISNAKVISNYNVGNVLGGASGSPPGFRYTGGIVGLVGVNHTRIENNYTIGDQVYLGGIWNSAMKLIDNNNYHSSEKYNYSSRYRTEEFMKTDAFLLLLGHPFIRRDDLNQGFPTFDFEQKVEMDPTQVPWNTVFRRVLDVGGQTGDKNFKLMSQQKETRLELYLNLDYFRTQVDRWWKQWVFTNLSIEAETLLDNFVKGHTKDFYNIFYLDLFMPKEPSVVVKNYAKMMLKLANENPQFRDDLNRSLGIVIDESTTEELLCGTIASINIYVLRDVMAPYKEFVANIETLADLYSGFEAAIEFVDDCDPGPNAQSLLELVLAIKEEYKEFVNDVPNAVSLTCDAVGRILDLYETGDRLIKGQREFNATEEYISQVVEQGEFYDEGKAQNSWNEMRSAYSNIVGSMGVDAASSAGMWVVNNALGVLIEKNPVIAAFNISISAGGLLFQDGPRNSIIFSSYCAGHHLLYAAYDVYTDNLIRLNEIIAKQENVTEEEFQNVQNSLKAAIVTFFYVKAQLTDYERMLTIAFFPNGEAIVPSQETISEYQTMAFDFMAVPNATLSDLYAGVLVEYIGASPAIAPHMVSLNSTIPLPTKQIKDGYKFSGWYSDADFMIPWDFAANKIQTNTKLYAKWTKVPSSSSGANNTGGSTNKSQVQNGNITIKAGNVSSDGMTKANISRMDLTEAARQARTLSIETGDAVELNVEVAVPQTATGVTLSIPIESLSAVLNEDVETLTLSAQIASVSLDQRAIQELTTKAESSDITFIVKKCELSDLPQEKMAKINGVASAYSLEMKADDKVISQSFGDGKARVLVPSIPAEVTPEKYVQIWHVKNEETKRIKEVQFNTSKNTASFELDGFSYIVLSVNPIANWTNVYTDVSESDWYLDAVAYVTINGLMEGIGENSFYPTGISSRAMLYTLLWRLEGQPKPTESHQYSDLPVAQWYTDAMCWAVENGLCKGMENGLLAPENALTREQIATIFFRYSQYKGYDTYIRKELTIFSDFDQIQPYALPALQWACGNGLVNGYETGELRPTGQASRVEMASMIYRFLEVF